MLILCLFALQRLVPKNADSSQEGSPTAKRCYWDGCKNCAFGQECWKQQQAGVKLVILVITILLSGFE